MSPAALASSIVAAFILLVPLGASAQGGRAVSLDATVGSESVRTDGEYRGPQRLRAADALLALRLGPAGRGRVVAGVTAGMPLPWATNALCMPSSTGGCIPSYPHFLKAGALVGWEHASTAFRAMAGPVYLDADKAHAFGVQGRLDGAVPIARRLALLASARGTMVPDYRGDEIRIYSFGVGIRIQ